MSRPLIVFVAVVLLVAFASAQSDLETDIEHRRHYSVSVGRGSAVLIDTRTGRTWLLQHPESDFMPSVWVPIRRLDDKEDVLRWRAEQAEQIARQSETAN